MTSWIFQVAHEESISSGLQSLQWQTKHSRILREYISLFLCDKQCFAISLQHSEWCTQSPHWRLSEGQSFVVLIKALTSTEELGQLQGVCTPLRPLRTSPRATTSWDGSVLSLGLLELAGSRNERSEHRCSEMTTHLLRSASELSREAPFVEPMKKPFSMTIILWNVWKTFVRCELKNI